jgi:hypothetical protein
MYMMIFSIDIPEGSRVRTVTGARSALDTSAISPKYSPCRRIANSISYLYITPQFEVINPCMYNISSDGVYMYDWCGMIAM